MLMCLTFVALTVAAPRKRSQLVNRLDPLNRSGEQRVRGKKGEDLSLHHNAMLHITSHTMTRDTITLLQVLLSAIEIKVCTPNPPNYLASPYHVFGD